jgi:hypothetical protein
MRTVALAELREEMLAAGDALVHALTAAATVTVSPIVLAELDDDAFDSSLDEPPESGHSPDHVEAAAIVTAEPGGEVSETPAAEEGRRPQRRRGRRGGRRNRPGGANGPRTPLDGGVPTEGDW